MRMLVLVATSLFHIDTQNGCINCKDTSLVTLALEKVLEFRMLSYGGCRIKKLFRRQGLGRVVYLLGHGS